MSDSSSRPLTTPLPSGYFECVHSLSAHLGKDFSAPGKWRSHPIGQLLADIKQYHFAGEVPNRELVISQLQMTVKHLDEVQAFDPGMHAGFRRRILRAKTLVEYVAIRMEVDIAASLARDGCRFSKTEHPDFTVRLDDGRETFIECSSVHLVASTARDASYKIRSCIAEKAKKPYAGANTALFIESTSYLHRGVQYGTVLPRAQMAELVQGVLASAEFGNVTIFGTYFTWWSGARVLEFNYIREDSSTIAAPLRDFLERWYPISRFTRGGARYLGVGEISELELGWMGGGEWQRSTTPVLS